MAVQDDERENHLVRLFNLTVPEDRRRDETDAYLDIDGRLVPFELKSTSRSSISTVRDFGPDHVRKWEGLHWIFGFFTPDGENLRHCHYASPHDMRPWIEEKWEYVRPDWQLAEVLPNRLTQDDVVRIVGDKDAYTLEDARDVQKRQYTLDEYRDLMDLEEGYSPPQMLNILRERCRYLVERGATLNNPHIPASYFEDWEEIVDNHAIRIRDLVREALSMGNLPPILDG